MHAKVFSRTHTVSGSIFLKRDGGYFIQRLCSSGGLGKSCRWILCVDSVRRIIRNWNGAERLRLEEIEEWLDPSERDQGDLLIRCKERRHHE